MELDMVDDMEVDKVSGMVADMMAVKEKNRHQHQHGNPIWWSVSMSTVGSLRFS